MAVIIVVTITGPDCELVADELAQELEDIRDSRDLQFEWESQVLETRRCTWH